MTVLSLDTVLAHSPASPFYGITIEKARVVNSAFGWRRVEVIGGRFSAVSPVEYVFYRIVLPGMIVTDPFVELGDMELWGWDHQNERGTPSKKRTISLSRVRSFRAIEAPELSMCHQCFVLLPQSQLKDAGIAFWGDDPTYPYESRLECAMCWEGP